MPKKVGSFVDRVRKSHEAHKGDETKLSGGAELPANIEGGIARLVDCRIGYFEKGKFQGEPFFIAAGVVVSPESVASDDGKTQIPIKGLRTQIGPEPICDTPGRSRESVDDHYAWCLNHLRLLGVATEEMAVDDFEATCEALVKAAPHFQFRTWRGDPTPQYPNPRTNHDWRGLVEHTEDDDDDVEEDVEEEEEEEEEQKTEAPWEEDNAGEETTEDVDWSALGSAADDGDQEAEQQLAEKAVELGIDYESADSWSDVASEILGGAKESEESEPEEIEEEQESTSDDPLQLGELADDGDQDAADKLTELAESVGVDVNEYETWLEAGQAVVDSSATGGEVPDIEVGEIHFYKPPKSKKAVEVEVIDIKGDKLTLKSLDDGREFKNVPIGNLEQE